MSCNTPKFTITKGLDNTFIFTIKADGTTLPMEIDEANDTFLAHLILLSDGSTVLTKYMSVMDALSGKVLLVFTAAEVATLASDRGTKVDRYYLRPGYKLVLECNTTNNGDFLAKVPEVYVD